jgi:hypothetical protein
MKIVTRKPEQAQATRHRSDLLTAAMRYGVDARHLGPGRAGDDDSKSSLKSQDGLPTHSPSTKRIANETLSGSR